MKENKEDNVIDGYFYMTISGESKSFDEGLTKACLDGFEIVETNSFAVQKPNLVKNSIDIIIVYTAILRRLAKFKKEEDENNG